ncbi:SEPT7 [Bugula neritina]|uniref:SEPT7 n=1 Tax=Bugula neritina TaxID=10212 RepID=A0A7J7JWY1_BUGNE|nr:SEPT7 [Bugula neritina]
MVVGESGLGKSTLINSLFLSDLYSAEYPGPSKRHNKTLQINPTQVLLREGGVQLKLNVVDTPGFGDAVDNSNCWEPVTNFIDSKLKPLDIEFMKRLHDKVNIIPLIAKADTLTPEECRDFKKTILNEIEKNQIRIYEFPDVEDEEENGMLKKLKERVPFAVVGSNRVMEVNGKKVRGRQYPWGVVEVDNLQHNDFLALRDMLIRTHMQDLRDVTNNVHYENYRYKKLANVSATDGKVKDGSR